MYDYDRPWGWKDYWVYIVKCSDGSYYTGVTNSVERRLNQHNLGINPQCYTYKRRPVRHCYSGHFSDIWEAIAWEKRVKKWSRDKKEALAKGEWEKLSELAHNFRRRTMWPIMLKVRGRVMVSLVEPCHGP